MKSEMKAVQDFEWINPGLESAFFVSEERLPTAETNWPLATARDNCGRREAFCAAAGKPYRRNEARARELATARNPVSLRTGRQRSHDDLRCRIELSSIPISGA
jgi:hypothetical protein